MVIQFFAFSFCNPFYNMLFEDKKIIPVYRIGIIAAGGDGVLDDSLLLLLE